MALVGYVNYATIYRRSPIGLPVPAILKQAKLGNHVALQGRLFLEDVGFRLYRFARTVDSLCDWENRSQFSAV